MKPFAYASPRSLDDAVALLTGDGEAKFLAGGTDLLTLLKGDLLEPSQLVDIKRLAELDDQITLQGDTVRIGALRSSAIDCRFARLTDYRYWKKIGEWYPDKLQRLCCVWLEIAGNTTQETYETDNLRSRRRPTGLSRPGACMARTMPGRPDCEPPIFTPLPPATHRAVGRLLGGSTWRA